MKTKISNQTITFVNKVLFFFMVTFSTSLIPAAVLGQGDGDQPCGGDSGGNPLDQAVCPLDTWVWILAIITVAFAAFCLKRKNKTISQLPLNG